MKQIVSPLQLLEIIDYQVPVVVEMGQSLALSIFVQVVGLTSSALAAL